MASAIRAVFTRAHSTTPHACAFSAPFTTRARTACLPADAVKSRIQGTLASDKPSPCTFAVASGTGILGGASGLGTPHSHTPRPTPHTPRYTPRTTHPAPHKPVPHPLTDKPRRNDTMTAIARGEGGIFSFWRGYTVVAMRALPVNVAAFSSYEIVLWTLSPESAGGVVG
jgi:hypothetical protein